MVLERIERRPVARASRALRGMENPWKKLVQPRRVKRVVVRGKGDHGAGVEDRLTRTLVVSRPLSRCLDRGRSGGPAKRIRGRVAQRRAAHQKLLIAAKSRNASRTRQRDARPRRAYIKSVASVHKTWRERGEFRLDQLFHGRASALRALGILLSMSSNVTWSTSWYSALPGTETRPACAAPLGVYRA